MASSPSISRNIFKESRTINQESSFKQDKDSTAKVPTSLFAKSDSTTNLQEKEAALRTNQNRLRRSNTRQEVGSLVSKQALKEQPNVKGL